MVDCGSTSTYSSSGETELYYLQSRYYNPELGRFINADAFTSTGQGLLGNNMFAYCANNPILFRDDTGTRHEIGAGAGFPVSSGSSGGPRAITSSDVIWPKNWRNAGTVIVAGVGSAALTGTILSIENQRQEQFSLRRFNRARSEEDELEGIANSYGNFECVEAAKSMADMLKKKGKNAEIITLTFVGGPGYIWSDIHNRHISENGIHVGLLYQGIVYCNVHPYGLLETQWIADFHAVGTRIITKTPI